MNLQRRSQENEHQRGSWIGIYEGEPILQLASGDYWSPNVGTYKRVEYLRKAIDLWLNQRDARGFEAGYFLT